jgi:hypothetical protein
MSKVADLVAAAAELNALQLKELRLEIQRLEQRRTGNRWDLDGFAVGLTRLDDGEYIRLGRHSIAIADDGMFLIQLLYPVVSRQEEQGNLNIAEFHFVLEHVYGESGLHYDDYKGSFSFPFALDVIRADQTFPYLLNVHNHRSSLEFSLRKFVGREGKVDHVVHPPLENEFGRKEINSFIAFFYDFLRGRLKCLLASGMQPTPFAHRVRSNLILYGYCDGRFFDQQFDREEEFYEAYRLLIAKVRPDSRQKNGSEAA